MRAARSSVVLAMPPMLSVRGDSGRVSSVLKAPTVTFIPKREARPAGCVMELSVSVARESGANPAASAAADLEEDPPGAL